MAARTENGKKAFIVNLEKESTHEDQHQLDMVPRQEAYATDITYGTNSEFGFDYLRDNMTMRIEDRVQRGHYYAIIDEVDNVLIDEARTPLIISGPAQDEAEWYLRMAQVVKQLRPEDYEISERDRNITLTEIGEIHVENLLGMPLRDPDRPEDVTLEQARMLGYLEQALRAEHLFNRNKDYLVQAGKVVIIDEFTGRLMPGRRWSDGLHQAVEAKEGVRVQAENVTYATITIQNYFRMYEKLSGMTGTAVTEAEEFHEIYNLEVLAIPTNLEFQASLPESGLEQIEDRDEAGYKYTYYAQRDDPLNAPIYWKRKDYPDVVYRTEEAKLRSVTREILQYHVLGRPILVGTTSVELSDRVSNRLRAEPLRRLAQILLIRNAWFVNNEREEDGLQVAELQPLNQPLDNINISEMRKMARDLNISFNPEDPANLEQLLKILFLDPSHQDRLAGALQAGIPHQVLNARKHTEESQIIANAGAFDAVTIATNMAGRGVDIKLGGDVAEEILSAVNRVLRRAGYDDPFDMSLEDRQTALAALSPDDYGIYGAEIQYFYDYMADMEKVRKLGGLHVIGSERHEARRIDNQLRGRSSRQGDPGSSRFYLSMEDELMRLFGGQQADSLMQRMKIDDAMPLEVGVVSRIVEQSQTRVEGANFDVRKHLLEYDDVLNTQRAKIYTQRNIIFTKQDLSEDIDEMLRTEVNNRTPSALEDEEGPWKLIAWLDQIQPPLQIGNIIFPSYTFKLLLDHLLKPAGDENEQHQSLKSEDALLALLDIAQASLDAEEKHIAQTITNLLYQTEDRIDSQLEERIEAVDTFFDGLSLSDETDTRSPGQLFDELQSLARVPLRLSANQQRNLMREPDSVVEDVHDQIEAYLVVQAINRLVWSVERRLDESLNLDTKELADQDWDVIETRILSAIREIYDRRSKRYIGEDYDGQIAKDLANGLSNAGEQVDRNTLYLLLMLMPQGSVATIDKKTHRRVMARTTRLTYTYYAAQFLQNREPEEITNDVFEHLEQAQNFMYRAWGAHQFSRIASSSLDKLDDTTKERIQEALGEVDFVQVDGQPLNNLPAEQRQLVISVLGRRALTEVYRHLLLQVITELWVDYLTQMEALRVSIGLEAYAQRDPLVQYKNRAFGLFQELLANMRTGVVNRMFTFRPREASTIQTTTAQQDNASQAEIPTEQPKALQDTTATDGAKKSKRKRRRRRRK
jgi:preprotein translocase subunit SecA